jgi:hypothetical protein
LFPATQSVDGSPAGTLPFGDSRIRQRTSGYPYGRITQPCAKFAAGVSESKEPVRNCCAGAPCSRMPLFPVFLKTELGNQPQEAQTPQARLCILLHLYIRLSIFILIVRDWVNISSSPKDCFRISSTVCDAFRCSSGEVFSRSQPEKLPQGTPPSMLSMQ